MFVTQGDLRARSADLPAATGRQMAADSKQVAAQLLSAADGIGAEVSLARTNLNTADLFAWALVLVAMVIVIEFVILKPFTSRLLRWRVGTQ